MWPVYVSQLADAIAPDAEPLLSLTNDRRALYRAIAWTNGDASAKDVLFVVEPAMHAEIAAALDRGAIVVVPRSWPGLNALGETHRSLVLVAEEPLAAFRRFAAFMRSRLFLPTIAVGGSNGKTTTKEMIVAALSGDGRRITATPGTNNGWVGVPITICHPWHTDPLPDALVLEIGIDEKGAMAEHVALARPNIAVLTALGIEHLAGLGTHEDAIAEELELFRAPRRVWNAEDPALAARLEDVRETDLVVHDIAHPMDVPCPTLAYAWRPLPDGTGVIDLVADDAKCTLSIPLPGAHNGRNAALAIGAALALGRTLDEAARGFARFEAPPQRCAVRTLPSGCILIDDTYNASPSSVEAALEVLSTIEPDRPRLIVLGDMLDLGEASRALHEELCPQIDRIANAHVRLYGEQMSALARKLERPLSIAASEDDPISLLDIRDLERHVVLVKASRGMRLERVVGHVLASESADALLEIGVVGADHEVLATVLRAALGSIARVRSLGTAELESPSFLSRRFDLGVLTGFSPKPNEDPERSLAAIAQLFVHLDENAGAVLARTDAEDEAPDLLVSVLGTQAREVRPCTDAVVKSVITTSLDLISNAISLAHELERRKLVRT